MFFHYDPTIHVCPTGTPQFDAFPATLPSGWPGYESSDAQSVAETVAESVLDDPVPVEEPVAVAIAEDALREPSDEPQAEGDWQQVGGGPATLLVRVRQDADGQPVCLGSRPDGQPCRHIVGTRPNGVRYPLCMQCRRRDVVGVCLHCDNVVRHQSHLECRACFECRN